MHFALCMYVSVLVYFFFIYVSNYCFFVIGGQHRWALLPWQPAIVRSVMFDAMLLSDLANKFSLSLSDIFKNLSPEDSLSIQACLKNATIPREIL